MVKERLNIIQALYALTLPWSLSSYSIPMMVLFQHASTTVRQNIESLRGGQSSAPFTETMSRIRRFYETLQYYNNNVQTTATNFPNRYSSPKGMRVSFRSVFFN
jgi:hypothetical protein